MTDTFHNTYSHGHSAGTLAGHRARTAETCAAFLLPLLKPGMALLDVGCGPGSITQGLADAVSPGRAVGLDQSAAAISAACAAFGPLNLEFVEGSLFALPFDDDTFDVVYCHQVMVHLPATKTADAMREVRRVLKPGGVFAAREARADMGGTQWYPHHALLDRTFDVVFARAYAGGATPRNPAALRTHARAAGFAPDAIELSFALEVNDTPDKRAALERQWTARASEPEFVAFARASGMMRDDEIEQLSAVWRAWSANEDAWETMLQIEMVARK
ncbi:hypothetical protein Q5752_000319 [Cryptotrichosporon argae]